MNKRRVVTAIAAVILGILSSITRLHAQTEIIKHTDKSFNTRVTQSKAEGLETIRIEIAGSNHKKSTVFSVPDPSRIVIDLLGAKIKKNKDYAVKTSNLIKGVRFGYHRDKIRIVVDLKQNKAIPFKVSEAGGKLNLTIEEDKAAKKPAVETIKIPDAEPETERRTPTPLPKAATKAATPSASPTALKQPDVKVPVIELEETEPQAEDQDEFRIEELIKKAPPTATPRPSLTPSRTPTIEPTATTAPSPTIAEILSESEVIKAAPEGQPTAAGSATTLPTTQALRAIKFVYAENSRTPLIKIELAAKSEFELKKAEEKLYVLTVKNCREYKPELRYVNFPPHDFAGFTYVQAEPSGTNIEIRIGVERGKRITARPNENDILVTLLQDERIETKSPGIPGKRPPPRAGGPSVAR